MMEYQDWLKALIQTAKKIASREYQEEHWFRENRGTEWADEVFLDLEGYAFDLFFKTYSPSFSDAQMRAWTDFSSLLDKYEQKLQRFPDSQAILDDPEWKGVQEAASRFVDAFEHQHIQPSATKPK